MSLSLFLNLYNNTTKDLPSYIQMKETDLQNDDNIEIAFTEINLIQF